MPVLGQNLCTPARIFGPPQQTLFCGCSVKSFAVSAGWNEQASNLTINVVEDTCTTGPKVWWDKNLSRQEGTIADPGFTSPEPGCAAYFRIEENPEGTTEAERGGFEYCGLIESWNESYDEQGNPGYTIKLTDPRIILENTQVIVNDFPGAVSGVWNLINAHAFVESLGSTCTSSPAGAMGGVTNHNVIGNITNARGMPWNDLKCAIHTLCSAVDKSFANSLYYDYCVDNRLVYIGPETSQEGYGIIEKDDIITNPIFTFIPNANLNQHYYYVDLTELPFSPDHYRISGPNISLMEIISQVCQDAGCDYYIELLPVISNGSVIKVIKVRVANRSSQPQMNRLDDFIAARTADATEAAGGVISYSKGEEVRNEETSTYLMGGKKRDGYTASSSQMLPYWGLDTAGNIIQATTTNGEYLVRMDFARVNGTLETPLGSQYAWVSEREFRAAMSDIDSWKEVTFTVNGDIATHLDTIGHKKSFLHEELKNVLEGKKDWKNIVVGPHNNIDAAIDESASRDLDKIYNFIKSYADEFYGKQFIVNAPFVCYAVDAESNQYIYSHEPSTEGCWVDDGTSTVIGLAHDSAASDFFRDDQGKYQAIVKYPLTNATNLAGSGSYVVTPEKLNDDNYISDAVDELWVKAEVDPQWLIGTPLNPSASTISFILRTPAPVTNIVSDTNNLPEAFGGVDLILDGDALAGAVPKLEVMSREPVLGAMHSAIAPTAAFCPRVSNVEVYGPWGVQGLPGQVNLETDEGLVPWEYGSDDVMYQAALNKVASSVTQMRKGERGSVKVAGFPNIPLGAELFSVDATSPPHSQKTQKYAQTRVYSLDHCASVLPYLYVAMNEWTGEFGPNVTNINVTVGEQGYETEYQFSTYTPRFGRFNKDNAERLKTIGKNRLQMMRNIRARSLTNFNIASSVARGKYIENQIGRSNRANKSPHNFLIGRYLEGDRPQINTQSAGEANLAFSKDSVYANSAMMSMDGLLRPVSRSGDGGLPRYVTMTGSCTGTYSGFFFGGSNPPVNEYTGINWTRYYLDPVSNSGDRLAVDLDNSSTPSGHDIEVLGRDERSPGSGWGIPESQAANTGGYSSDYRFFALRGPILLQQYGKDDQGKPVPNAVDTDALAESGIYQTTGLTDKYLDNFMQKPKTWPVAPLDITLDRKRGVWTFPKTRSIVHATVSGSITGWAETGLVFYANNLDPVYNATGKLIEEPTITVEWPWDLTPHSQTGKVPVYYDHVDCKYYGLPMGGTLDTCYTDWRKAHRIGSLRPVLYSGWPSIVAPEDRTTGNIISGCDSFSATTPWTNYPNSGLFSAAETGALSSGQTGIEDCKSGISQIDFRYGFAVDYESSGNKIVVDATDWKIRFTITSVTSGLDTLEPAKPIALAAITAVPVGRQVSEVPYQLGVSGLVEVQDPLGCFFSEPYGDLIDRKGWAQLMAPTTTIAPNTGFAESGTTGLGLVCTAELPVWEVFSLCCDSFDCSGYF